MSYRSSTGESAADRAIRIVASIPGICPRARSSFQFLVGRFVGGDFFVSLVVVGWVFIHVRALSPSSPIHSLSRFSKTGYWVKAGQYRPVIENEKRTKVKARD
jgi:hypothetical protein